MQTGQTNTGSNGPKVGSPKLGFFKRVHGLTVKVEPYSPSNLVFLESPLFGSFTNEAALGEIIETLKAAKAHAWPKKLKALTPQANEVLRYLQRYDAITPLKASEELGVSHLPRRIKDLKEHGHKIKTTYETGYHGKRYARYSLAKSLVVGGVPVRTSTFDMVDRI